MSNISRRSPASSTDLMGTKAQESAMFQYHSLLKTPGVLSVALAMVVARMPTGCISVLLVLFVSEQYGAALSGMAAAAWTVGAAVFAPALGRLVDRGSGPRALVATAALQAVAVAALIASVSFGAPAPCVLAVAFASGACTPPVAGTTRALWKLIVPEDLLSVAYSFEILVIDVLYVSGPLIASAFMTFGVPAWGIALTTACLVAGSIALSRLEPVRRYASLCKKGERRNEGSSSRTLLRNPSIVLLLLACAGTMAFSGWLETILPLFYSAQDRAFEGGVAISVWSIGSIVGVFAFVRTQKSIMRIPLVRQLALCTLAYALVCSLLIFGNGWGIAAVCAIMFAIGCAVSPCTNLHYQLGGDMAPSLQHAEMFSWLNTATSAGISLGALLAGNAVECLGFELSFALPIAFVAFSLVCALVLSVKASSRL